jgi:hypothetical protein
MRPSYQRNCLSALFVCFSNEKNRELNSDGKSLANPPAEKLSSAYEKFPNPIDNGEHPGGFDVHIYYYQVSSLLGFRKLY